MAQPRKYPTAADRQRAYRERLRLSQALALTELRTGLRALRAEIDKRHKATRVHGYPVPFSAGAMEQLVAYAAHALDSLMVP